jgi:hypothetical protein
MACAESRGQTGAAASGALDLHEESFHPGGSEEVPWVALRALTEDPDAAKMGARLRQLLRPDPGAGGCPRWPENMRLLSSQGELVRGRCASTNLCDYCARLGAVENAEVLALDALHGVAPTCWAVLTTRTASTDPRRFYKSRQAVIRALQRRWPAVEYAALVEFTTGYGPRSGGRRRPHWNLLLKGIPADDVERAGEVIRRVWCAREDARPEGQYVGTVGEAGGLMRYLALHFQKESQKPPAGWRGHRFLKSRGYLTVREDEGGDWRPMPAAREEAKATLRWRRELWKAEQQEVPEDMIENVVRDRLAVAAATSWELRFLTRDELAART